MSTEVQLTREVHLTRNIVVVDGLTGTGKTMYGPLVSSFSSIENGRFYYPLEYVCIANYVGELSNQGAKVLVSNLSDVIYSDGLISREVNFRPKDLSTVWTKKHFRDYVRRLIGPDGEYVLEKIEKDSPVLLLLTHQLLGAMSPFFSAFSERIKVIEAMRHPLYLVHHWESNFHMWGNSKRDTNLWILGPNGEALPWYAKSWLEHFLALSDFDRVLESIAFLSNDAINKSSNNESVLSIPFEHFVTDTQSYIKKIAKHINSEPTKHTKKVLKKQNLPRIHVNYGPQKEIYKKYGSHYLSTELSHQDEYQKLKELVNSKGSSKSIVKFNEAISKYEEAFGLWF